MKKKTETATGYLSMASDAFQRRISAILSPFEDYEYRALYKVVDTYEPLEIINEELYLKQSFHTYMRKRDLSSEEKEMIEEYLATHSVTVYEPNEIQDSIDMYCFF
jgi:hypothetical protein